MELLAYFSFKGLVFHFECYFDDPIFSDHAHFWKEPFVQFYHDNNVEVHYKVHVDPLQSHFLVHIKINSTLLGYDQIVM